MKNLRNFGVVTGRLTNDPVVYNNRDGSRKVKFAVAAPNQYTDKDGNRGSQFIPLEAYIPASQQRDGAYGYMNQGDLVSCSYTIQNNNYMKDGKMVYGLVLMVDSVALLDSRAAKEARQAARMAS